MLPFSSKLLASDNDVDYICEAEFYQKLDDSRVQCQLCPRGCTLRDGKRGVCRVRENQEGILKTLVFGRIVSFNIDPIEKKPLFHFLPGTNATSIATAGCNVKCKFCQNWNISQVSPDDVNFRFISPDHLVSIARENASSSIAFTYSEPVVFYEYVHHTAQAARDEKLRSVMITNGYINSKPLLALCNYLDAIKIDFKSFNEDFYQNIVFGHLQPVLDSMVLIKESGLWLELVYLVIPTMNDDHDELKQMCRWIMENLGPDVPLHFTRFHPQYLMKNLPPTSLPTLKQAYQIAKDAGIHYVYIGNVPGQPEENTYCHNCGKLLIERQGYFIKAIHIKNNCCIFCSTPIPGIWS
jgi:pyruvate formate lyase activating enzyme